MSRPRASNCTEGQRQQQRRRRRCCSCAVPAAVVVFCVCSILLSMFAAGASELWASYQIYGLDIVGEMRSAAAERWRRAVRPADGAAPPGRRGCASRCEHARFFPAGPRREARAAPQFAAAWERYQRMHRSCTEGRDLAAAFLESSSSGRAWRPEARQDSPPPKIPPPPPPQDSSPPEIPRCRYLVYLESQGGLGNRLLSLATAFTYALATDRVLLVDTRKRLAHLLCEPFLESSWLLPPSFPYPRLDASPTLHRLLARSRSRSRSSSSSSSSSSSPSSMPPVVRLNLNHARRWGDESFFCDGTQRALARDVPWLGWSSNQYYVTELFMMPALFARLRAMFPMTTTATPPRMDSEGSNASSSSNNSYSSSSSSSSFASVFTIVGRRVLLPSDEIWAVIKGHYDEYLGDAGVRAGAQIRLHGYDDPAAYEPSAFDKLERCFVGNGILPKLGERNGGSVDSDATGDDGDGAAANGSASCAHRGGGPAPAGADVAVLVAALQGAYARELVRKYTGREAGGGGRRVVRFHTASEMLRQANGDDEVRMALAEMWLLAFGHVLITSAFSTFGYIAQGVGALRPHILHVRKGDDSDDLFVCSPGQSVEPCTHFPVRLHCTSPESLTTEHSAWIAAHVRECQDQPGGWQLVDHDDRPPTPSLASFFGP